MNRQVYLYLLKTYGRQPRYWLAYVCVIFQTVILRVVSVVVIAKLAGAIATGDTHGAKVAVFMYLGLGLLGLGFRVAKDVLAIPTENGVYGQIMVNFYGKLVGKDMHFYRDHQTGYLTAVFRQHLDTGMELVRLFRGELTQTFISLTVPVVVLFVASWWVGLVALVIVVIQIIYVFWASAIVNKYRERAHEVYRRISGVVADDVTNVVAFKTSGAVAQATANVRKLAKEETSVFWLRRKFNILLDAPRDGLTMVATAAAFWMIISHAQGANQSVGLVVLTVTYMFQIFRTVTDLPDLITRHDDLVTKLYPTLEYMTDKYESIKDPAKPRKLVVPRGRIDINKISFAYKDQSGRVMPVFKEFDLHIRGGEQVGVVGLSGAGKSTLASLLMRFDDIDSGAIEVDGIDIRQVRQTDLRQHIAYVPQEPLLFHRTIRDNLQYYGQNSDADMKRAAKAAHADEFISRLQHGYDTMVGERGVKLSGGQKQRVVIARAILKNAPIMLFDEATSALDSESEKIIQQALPGIIGKRTALVIAHRLSTVAGLDRIIVLHDGVIVEEGTHAQLLQQKGRYHSLWQKQIAA